MEESRTTVSVSIDVALKPQVAFDVLADELTNAFALKGMSFEAGRGGRVIEGNFEVGRVINWESGKLIQFRWRQASWETDEVTEVEMQFEPIAGGTQIRLVHKGWGSLIGDSHELIGWFASSVAAPFLQATAPESLMHWLTDRQARRPSGAQARTVYQDPLYHYPNFYVILDELALSSDDFLVEIGCGGGALLKEALKSGCRAAAIDHSPDMVRLAREMNQDAVTQGRLEILQASADHLPFADETFTCAMMTGVLGFLPDPVAAFREMRRVLRSGGRIVILGSDPKLRGTLAAPEPMASQLHFYEDDEFKQLAVEAGFDVVEVVKRDLEPFARQVGVPEEHLVFFQGGNASFLLACKN